MNNSFFGVSLDLKANASTFHPILHDFNIATQHFFLSRQIHLSSSDQNKRIIIFSVPKRHFYFLFFFNDDIDTFIESNIPLFEMFFLTIVGFGSDLDFAETINIFINFCLWGQFQVFQ